MSPGRAFPSSAPAAKKRKPAKFNDEPLDVLSVAKATLQSDILATPPVSQPLTDLINDLPSPPSEKKIDEIKEILLSIKQKKIELDSAIFRNMLRKTFKGGDITSLLRSNSVEILKCMPPKRVEVVGSYPLGCGSPTVDIAVEMSEELFGPKDYQNYIYHDKRVFFLIFLARHVLKSEYSENVSLLREKLAGDEILPLLSISLKNSYVFRILPCLKRDLFDKNKLQDNRKNLVEKGESSLVSGLGTVAYNQSVLLDMSIFSASSALLHTKNQAPAFVDTVQLLNAWSVRQRLIPKFLLEVLVHHVIKAKLAPARASREHLLRASLNCIRNGALDDLEFEGVKICYNVDKGRLKRTSFCAAIALSVMESRTAGIDPWFGVVPYLFARSRGTGVSSRPLCCMFDVFVRVEGAKKSDVLRVLEMAVQKTGRVKSIEHIENFLYGMQISSYDDIFRKVDICPEELPTEKFKSFWGSKSVLRRFKDGKIVESVVWDGGYDTLAQIVSYALKRHISEDVIVKVIAGEIEKASLLSPYDLESSKAIVAFNELASMLRSLDGLPLSIRGVHATSSHLRRCGAYPFQPQKRKRFVTPLEMVAAFESSSAWPDDPVAISAAKAAFYVTLKGKLSEHGISSWATISWIDIDLGGFTFRLRIKVDREDALLKGVEERKRLEWMMDSLVQHHDCIRNVKHPLMGFTARLVKRWLNDHLLLMMLGKRADELVETIVAFCLSGIDPRKSVQGAFCQVLYVLAEFPYEIFPLVVRYDKEEDEDADLGEKEAQRYEMMRSAQKNYGGRKRGLGIYSAQDNDGEATSWFEGECAPENVIVNRMRETARASLQLMERHLITGQGSLGSVVTANTSDFDAVISVDLQSYSELRSRGISRERMLPGFDPVQRIVDELRRRLGHLALFMWKWGSETVYVVWKPRVQATAAFRLRECSFRIPNQGDLRVNLNEVMAEMKRIGGSAVVSVKRVVKNANS